MSPKGWNESGAIVTRPPTGEVRLVDDVPAGFARLVSELAAHSAGRSDGRFRLALSGGGTARRCYERLAEGDVEWSRLECFFGDERCVPPESEEANQRLVRDAFGEAMGKLAAFHPMDCDDPQGYENLLAEAPSLDLIHLGLGPDGHTASLFPGSTGLEAPESRLVVRNSDPTGRNLHERLTLTFGAIARWSTAVFTVAGVEKRDALRRVCAGEDLPASRVRAGRVIWLCDHEALGDGCDSIE